MSASELRVFLRRDSSIREDPGAVLDETYETITIITSSETFVFSGNGNATARYILSNVRLAQGSHGTPRYMRCHGAILADMGGLALIVFAKKDQR